MGWPIKAPSTIYAIRCKENGKVYIGRTQNLERRMKEHLSEFRKKQKDLKTMRSRPDRGFQSDFERYGENAFELYVLEDGVSPKEAVEREYFWIESYRSTEPEHGYNKQGRPQKYEALSRVMPGRPPVPPKEV